MKTYELIQLPSDGEPLYKIVLNNGTKESPHDLLTVLAHNESGLNRLKYFIQFLNLMEERRERENEVRKHQNLSNLRK